MKILRISPHHEQLVVYLCEPGMDRTLMLTMPDAWLSPEQVGMLSGTSCAMMVPPPAPVPLSEPLFT